MLLLITLSVQQHSLVSVAVFSTFTIKLI